MILVRCPECHRWRVLVHMASGRWATRTHQPCGRQYVPTTVLTRELPDTVRPRRR